MRRSVQALSLQLPSPTSRAIIFHLPPTRGSPSLIPLGKAAWSESEALQLSPVLLRDIRFLQGPQTIPQETLKFQVHGGECVSAPWDKPYSMFACAPFQNHTHTHTNTPHLNSPHLTTTYREQENQPARQRGLIHSMPLAIPPPSLLPPSSLPPFLPSLPSSPSQRATSSSYLLHSQQIIHKNTTVETRAERFPGGLLHHFPSWLSTSTRDSREDSCTIFQARFQHQHHNLPAGKNLGALGIPCASSAPIPSLIMEANL